MSHTGGDANSSDRARGQGIKKSNFPAQSIIPGDATFDFVSAGHNFKITIADLLTALGVTGSIQQAGDAGDVPILDDQGAVKGIRNIAAGFGIAAKVDAQNSVEIATDFTFNEIGTTLVDDPSASAAVFRSLVAGSGINISSVPGQIQIASTVVPASTKTVIVAEKSDLPAPAVGVITLAADTHYLFTDDVSIGTDRLDLNGNIITAADSSVIQLTYTGTGNMITTTGTSDKFAKITLSCPNGTLFDVDGLGTGVFQTLDMTIKDCVAMGTWNSLAASQINNTAFDEITGNGLLFTGSHGLLLETGNVFNLLAGTLFDFGTATFDAISLTSSFPTIAAGATFASGLINSGNINVGGFATIQDITQSVTGTPLVGISPDDVRWQFALNNRIADTRPDILCFLSAPATTTITTVNTPVLVNGVFTQQTSSQFTASTSGRVTYDGIKPAKLPISVSLSQEPVSGTNKDITAYIGINGVVQIASGIKVRRSSGSPGALALTWQHDFQPNDFVEVFVENNSDNIDILTNNLLLRVN